MNDYKLYISSDILKSRIYEIAKDAAERTNNHVLFEEYIALPFFGHIILRFSLTDSEFSLSDLDRYETLLYDIAGREFLVNFMGSVYAKVGADLSGYEELFSKLAMKFENEPVYSSSHRESIQKDAAYLLSLAGLDQTEKVWEIQIEDDEPVLYVMGPETGILKEKGKDSEISVWQVKEESCVGLIKAALQAKRLNMSLARLWLESEQIF